MTRTMIAAAGLAWVLGSAPAPAIELSETVTVPGAPNAVWAEIGGFCDIAAWHDAVADCAQDEADGTARRTLTLEGGGTILEERTEAGETSYAYVILESPLPVADYASRFTAQADGDGTRLTWEGTFDAEGATEDEAEATIRGIYRSGLDAIAAMME